MDPTDLQQSTQFLSGHGWPWAWLALALVGALLLLAQAYRWIITPAPPAARVALCLLRFSWVALLLWCLWDPQREEKTTRQEGQFPDAMVVIDASQSMGMPAASRPSAWPSVLEAARDLENALPPEIRTRTEWRGLGAQLAEWNPAEPPPPEQEQTRLLEQLGEAARTAPRGNEQMALFLISDGQDTTGAITELPAIAAEMAASGIHVYPVIPADPPQPVQFVRLRGVELPPSVAANAIFPLRVRWNCVLRTPATFTLELTDAATGQVLTTREVTMDGSAQGQESFNLRAATPGLLEIQARLIPRDARPAGEPARGATAVVKREGTRILLVQGSLDWEFRFVRAALSENPSLNLDALIRMNDKSFVLQKAGEELITGPGDALNLLDAQVGKYDVVILANTNPELIRESSQKELLRVVRERGTGILFFSGNAAQSSRFRSTLLEQLLPVVLENYTERLEAEDSFSRTFRDRVYQGSMKRNEYAFAQQAQAMNPSLDDGLQAMALTPEGRDSEIWRDAAKATAPTPPPTFLNSAMARSAKPGATVLAQHPEATNSEGQPRPLMAVQRVGAGRAAFVGVDNLWRWRMGAPSEAREYDRFWQQLLLWLGQGAAGNELKAERFQYRPGDSASFTFGVRGDGATTSATTAKPSLRVFGPESAVSNPPYTELPLDLDTGSGQGRASHVLAAAGSYRFELRNGDELLAAQTVVADTQEVEREFSGMNLPLLRGLAEATGGQMLTAPENLRLIPDLLAGTRQTVTETSRTSLWRLNWIFLLILGLYLVELMVRRRFLLT